ncbi:MAG: GTP-binding protein [Verrucomicrobiales bacterium]|nr:GTP-binding protein [Verrucomicrobiales bacterium]
MLKPLLFITGFLGAGKTTLLRTLLEEYRKLGRSADVILNDFENAEIDASTLDSTAASIFPISASCACCDSLDDLVKLCLAARESSGESLFIELNGTADPLPLLESFTILEEKLSYFPRWQIAVIDARHWGNRGVYNALEKRQLETATHWLLTHSEKLSPSEVDAVSSAVTSINPHASRVTPRELASDLVASRESADQGDRQCPPAGERPCESDSVHDHEHSLSHQFTGYQIPLPGRFRKYQIQRLLELLPDEVVRAKALVKLTDPPGTRWLFERTGREAVSEPVEVKNLPNTKTSLVCIGPALNPGDLDATVTRHFGWSRS